MQVLSPIEAERRKLQKVEKERVSLVADAMRSHVVEFRKTQLNEFLKSSGLAPVRKVDMGSPTAAERTRRRNIAEACQVMVAVLRVLSPNYPCELWLNVKDSNDMCEALEVRKEVALREDDVKYLRALSESYNNATSANVKLQILSIMADITTLQEIRNYIPGLTKYMFCQARQHILVSGRGAPVIAKQSPRWRIDLNQLDHFLDFITSPYIVQDLPFGERFLKLSTGEVVQTPNVIRVSVSGHIIDQYVQYCNETEVKPLSNSTLRRILSSCQASTRKSLQGLDYFVCEGSKAFDDLEQLIGNLVDSGFDARTAQNLQMKLKEGKNYVKTDFKVRTYGNIIIKCVIPENVHTPPLPPPQRAREIRKGGGSIR